MAVGFSEEDLINLGVDMDPGVFAQIQAALNGVQEQAEAINATFDTMATSQSRATEAMTAGFEQAKSAAQELADQINQINQGSQFQGYLGPGQNPYGAYSQGYGVTGGMIGPAEGEDGGGGGPGSFFALGHGLSVAGHALGSPGLREAGGFVYIEEGVRRTMPMLEEMGLSLTTLAGVGLPLVAALTAIGAEFNQLTQIIEQGRKAVDDALSDQVKYYEYTATHTSDDAKARIGDEEKIRDANLKAAQSARNVLASLVGGKNSPEEIEAALKENKPEMLHFDVTQAPAVLALFEQIKKLEEAAGQAQTKVDELANGIQKGDFAANDAAKNQIDNAQRESELRKQEYTDSQMTTEAAKKRLDMLKADATSTQEHLAALAPLVDKNADAKKQYDELNAKLADETSEIDMLTQVIIPETQAREAENNAIKETKKQLDDAAKAIDDFGKTKSSIEQQAADNLANVTLRERLAEQQYHEGSLQDIYARNEIAEKESRKETDIHQESADKIVDIRTKLTTTENKIALDYQQQREDDALAHAEKLADIERKTQSDQTQALLDRNFLQLAKGEQAKDDQIAAENRHYAEVQAKDQQTLQRKMQDAEIAANAEINQQVVNEARKIEAAQLAEKRQLEDLTTSEGQKIAIMRINMNNELILYQQQEQQRLNIALQTQNAIVSHAMATIAQIGAQQIGQAVGSQFNQQNPFVQFIGNVTHGLGFAEGGNFGAGEPFTMSENWPETLQIGSRGYRIPGAALVMPLQGGSVDKNGGGGKGVYAPTNNFYQAQDLAATQRMVEQVQQRQLKEFFGH